jgi:hypothetical protein
MVVFIFGCLYFEKQYAIISFLKERLKESKNERKIRPTKRACVFLEKHKTVEADDR